MTNSAVPQWPDSAAPLDIPQRFVFSYAHELPWGKGKRWLDIDGPFGGIVSGWQISGITTLSGSFPTDIRSVLVPPTIATFNVPDRVPGVSMYAPNKGVDQYFNPAAFRAPGTWAAVGGRGPRQRSAGRFSLG